MLRLITALIFLSTTVALQSQNNETDPYIEVTGSSEMSVIPDIIVYTVELEEYEKDRQLVPLALIEGKFLEAVRISQIAKENINVSDISSYSFNVKRKRKAFASKTYHLTFSKPEALVAFIDKLENLDIKRQFISRIDHTEMTKFRLEIKKSAMAAARDKATELLSVVDTELGKPLIIREINSGLNLSQSNLRRASNSLYGSSAANLDKLGLEIDFEPIKLRFEIFARFGIK